jgi:hypothetical protein
MRPHSRLTSRQSKRFVDRKNNRSALTILLVVFCIALWIYCFSCLTYLNAFTINNFAVNGVDPSNAAKVEGVAQDAIGGSYLGLFAKSNIFIYPHSRVAAAIQANLPSIENLTIRRQGLQGLEINVVEKTPAALICATLPDFSGESLTIDDSNNCYFVDKTGYIFERDTNASSSLSIYNRYYFPDLSGAASTTSSIIGSYATSTKEFTELQKFTAGARQAGLEPAAILAKDGGEYEMYANNTVIYFNDQRPFPDQLSNLSAFWNKMNNGNGSSTKKANLEYIDVRYGSNVFYREIK